MIGIRLPLVVIGYFLGGIFPEIGALPAFLVAVAVALVSLR